MNKEAGGARTYLLTLTGNYCSPLQTEVSGGPPRVMRRPHSRSMPEGSNSVLNGNDLVLESPSPPRFDGKSWAITGPTWKGFEHIRYVFIL